MDIKQNYKKEMDRLCDSNLKLTAEDILNAGNLGAKSATVTDLKGARKNMKLGTKIASIAAICVVATGATGVAAGVVGYGPLADIFAKKASIETSIEETELAKVDKVSSYLANQGYLLQIGETQSVDGFDITLEGVTGDTSRPQLLFSIKAYDEDFIAKNKDLECTVYPGLSEEAYAKRTDLVDLNGDISGTYIWNNSKAIQDPEDPSVYYLTTVGAVDWMGAGADVVVEFRSILPNVESQNDPNKEIFTHLVYRFTMPGDSSALKVAHEDSWSMDEADSFTASNGIEFFVTEAIFGEYETTINMEFELVGTEFEEYVPTFFLDYDLVVGDIIEPISDVRLVVDGVEYEPIEGSYDVFCDMSKDTETTGHSNTIPAFESIDYDNATSITLKYGDFEIVIK